MPHSDIKKNKKTKWNEEVTAISYCKTTTIKKTSTKTHGTSNQCVLLHWSLTSQVKVGNRVSVHGIQPPWTYNMKRNHYGKDIPLHVGVPWQISLWQFGMHSCIHGLILCWLPWSMLQYISRVPWRWGGIYVRMSYWFISQVVSSKRIYNDGCDDTKLTVSSACILRCHKSTSQPSGLIRPP